MAPTPYTPWRTNYLAGIFLLILANILIMPADRWFPILAPFIYLLFNYCGAQQLWRGMRRHRGAIVERHALASLRHHADAQGIRYSLREDIQLPSHENIDCLFQPDWASQPWVIEIKSGSGFVQRTASLVTQRNRMWSRHKDFNQVWRQVKQITGWQTPAIWCPESRLRTIFIHQGVLVINGDAVFLIAALRWASVPQRVV